MALPGNDEAHQDVKEVKYVASVGEKFKCEICGNVVEVIESGGNPEIFCCGQSMTKIS